MARNSYAETKIPTGKTSPVYMDAQQIVNGFLGHNAEVEFGTVTGTGALITIATSFDPAMIMVINQTDSSIHFLTPSMPAGSMMSIKAAAAYVGTNGLSLLDGGFTIGTNADLNAVADVLHWTALAAPDRDGSL
ncbi:hypothetical protein K0U83_23225 [bacterium]|nr:hypothetical protein [bacterium]